MKRQGIIPGQVVGIIIGATILILIVSVITSIEGNDRPQKALVCKSWVGAAQSLNLVSDSLPGDYTLQLYKNANFRELWHIALFEDKIVSSSGTERISIDDEEYKTYVFRELARAIYDVYSCTDYGLKTKNTVDIGDVCIPLGQVNAYGSGTQQIQFQGFTEYLQRSAPSSKAVTYYNILTEESNIKLNERFVLDLDKTYYLVYRSTSVKDPRVGERIISYNQQGMGSEDTFRISNNVITEEHINYIELIPQERLMASCFRCKTLADHLFGDC